MSVGLDIGTNMLVSATMDADGNPLYKKQRDAFLRITPKSKVNQKSIRIALEHRKANFIIDEIGDFIIVGEDALRMANERNLDARRPMSKGVLSPKEKDSLPMIKLIIKSLIGQGSGDTNLVFSVPADPVDGEFDIFFHTEMLKSYLKEMGFMASPMNEAFAIAFSELLDDSLTGMCMSFGAGLVNTAVVYEGDPLLQFSVCKSGDWIDQSVGKAVDERPSLIQIEKEEGNIDLMKPDGKIQEAIAIYYNILIGYALDNVVYELSRSKLPSFKTEIPIVVSGGLTLAKGFVEKFGEFTKGRSLPFKVKDIRRAKDPMTCVSNGCLMAAILLDKSVPSL